MDYIFYLFIFIIGIVFGSFYTLAVYRIPKKQDITHTHSYCPNCQHKLSFLDLIPLFSYIFLKGKCRYCKEKIRPRYFIIELISGLLFVIFAHLINFNLQNLTIAKILDFSFLILYFTFVVLIAGTDKDNRQIYKGISYYGIIISIMYMIYLYIIVHTSIYRYAIYLILYAVILLLDNITLRKYAKNTYVYGIILTIITMCIFTGEYIVFESIITVLLASFIYLLIKTIQNKIKAKKEKFYKKMQIGYMLGISNISFLIYILAVQQYFL